MIGNDIVDLKFAKLNSRWEEQRFLDKLFNREEQEFILKEDLRFQNIWRLWSMKESAYKAVSRNKGIRKFNPKAFECKLNCETYGVVKFQNETLQTETIVFQDYIYTTAFTDLNVISSSVFNLTEMDPEGQHLEMKAICLNEFSKLRLVPSNTVSIEKTTIGAPLVYIQNTLQKEIISITHHGAFGGLAIAI